MGEWNPKMTSQSKLDSFPCIAVITVEPAGKASFVLGCIQTRLMGQYNAKWPISLVYMWKPLITVITAIVVHGPKKRQTSLPFNGTTSEGKIEGQRLSRHSKQSCSESLFMRQNIWGLVALKSLVWFETGEEFWKLFTVKLFHAKTRSRANANITKRQPRWWKIYFV